LETVAICQRRFVEESATIRDYLARNTQYLADEIQFLDAATGEALTSAHPLLATAAD
jgi:hypothetical protein